MELLVLGVEPGEFYLERVRQMRPNRRGRYNAHPGRYRKAGRCIFGFEMRKKKKDPRTPRMRLKRLSIQGFKAVKASGYVDLEPLTLFIGRNGSGKSSLVEALQWMQDAYFDGLLKATDSRFRAFSYLLNKRSRDIKLHLEFEATPKPVFYDLGVRRAVAGD